LRNGPELPTTEGARRGSAVWTRETEKSYTEWRTADLHYSPYNM